LNCCPSSSSSIQNKKIQIKNIIMQKSILFFSISLIFLLAACDKYTTLPSYTAAVSPIFAVATLNHTEDSVNVGDTIYLVATGTIYDTTKFVYTFLTATYTASGVSAVYTYGSSTSPVKLSPVFGASTTVGLFTWTDTIMLPGATFVPPKTKLTIVGNFLYQLSLSSVLGTLSATDAGIKNKTVYVE
jgi:hypothetical protein